MIRADERGQVAAFVLGLVVIVFAVTGLAIDGTRAFLARRSLQNAADSSALAASGELDVSSLYSGRGYAPRLAPERARALAGRWLAARAFQGRAEIRARADRVEVVLRTEVPTTFLRLLGIPRVSVAAESVAEPAFGSP